MLRFTASGGVTGAACFAVAVLAHTGDSWVALGFLAVTFVCVGGWLASWSAGGRGGPLAVAVIVVVAGRILAGTWAALLIGILLGLGAVLRVRLPDVRYGLAAVGAMVALVGRAQSGVVLAFWLLGLLMTLAWRAALAVRSRLRRAPAMRGPVDAGPAPITVIWS